MDKLFAPTPTAEPTTQDASRTTSQRSPYTLFLVFTTLAILVGMALTIFATSDGPGVGGDATIYLTTARNFYAGHGLGWVEADGTFRLLPYTPPFYPLVLGAAGLGQNDLTQAARWLNAFLLGLTSLLAGWSVFRAARLPWLAALVSGLAALSPVVLNVHLWAMSEPLFLCLTVGSLYLLWTYLDRPRRALLAGAGLLAGLALLTRYIGVAVVLTGLLALLFGPSGLRRAADLHRFWRMPAFRDALLYGVIAALPMLIWLAVGLFFTGTVASRSGQPASAYWQRFLEIGPALQQIYMFWLLPDSISARLPGLLQSALWFLPLLALVVLLWFHARKQASACAVDGGANRLAGLYALFIVLYLLVLAGVQVFTYPPVTLASRMLSPVHLAVLVALPLFLWQARARLLPASRLALIALSLVGLGLLGSYALRSVMIVREYRETGIGYNAAAWRESRTVAQLMDLPPGVPIISNEVTAVMYFTGRPAFTLQEIYQDQPTRVFSVYGSGDDPGQLAFRERRGALVLFYNTLYEDFAMYGDRVEERLAALTHGLYPYYTGEDGAIYLLTQPTLSDSICTSCRENRYQPEEP